MRVHVTSHAYMIHECILSWSTRSQLIMVSDLSFLFLSGVKQERLLEGLSPRHCALSLVGEPIMYPEINTIVDELHRRHISTFLVTNAQFPERIEMLKPVTQVLLISWLYFACWFGAFNAYYSLPFFYLADHYWVITAICKCRCCFKGEPEGY